MLQACPKMLRKCLKNTYIIRGRQVWRIPKKRNRNCVVWELDNFRPLQGDSSGRACVSPCGELHCAQAHSRSALRISDLCISALTCSHPGRLPLARNREMTPAGLEPAMPGSIGRCLIHWATGPITACFNPLTFGFSCKSHASALVLILEWGASWTDWVRNEVGHLV